ncbi:hypothetical protein GO003_002815 [Methylicorpusculum oleiharenae]|uniref:DUF7673 family protein n=1 Tax=Methylicorpusculum oleiharenae TaxID=1338687 RepID=UPI0019D1E5CA|nr:hypothetical protein [Methylicorpusculum oleiharenae]MCD2449320.1 hypothetical protein [Methylicorpusculum oleiharenae]
MKSIPTTVSFGPKTDEDHARHDAANVEFARQMREYREECQKAIGEGEPALIRLVEVAKRDTGQSLKVRSFLLGLYNSYDFPFELTSLRGLDKSLFDDCIKVLTLDARVTAQEIHLYIDDGDRLFSAWAKSAMRTKS